VQNDIDNNYLNFGKDKKIDSSPGSPIIKDEE
jgi:hypothetical protein